MFPLGSKSYGDKLKLLKYGCNINLPFLEEF